MYPSEFALPPLTIIADFNHDGSIDDSKEEVTDPASAFAIAVPVSGIPDNYDDWLLMGGVDPLEVGKLKVSWNRLVSQAVRLELRTEESWRNKVKLFYRDNAIWRLLRSEDQWEMTWDECKGDPEVTLGLVVIAPTKDTARSGLFSSEDSFILEIAVFGNDDSLLGTDSIRFVVCPFIMDGEIWTRKWPKIR